MLRQRNRSIDMVLVATGVIVAIGIRLCLFDRMSGDLQLFVLPWYKTLQQEGFSAFRRDFSNYNPVYPTLLWVAARLFPNSVSPLWAAKSVAASVDFLAAFLVFKLVRIFRPAGHAPYFAAIALLFNPTTVINSSYWGQCDIVYTLPLLASVLMLYRQRPLAACVFAGLALAVKAQAAFFLPALALAVLRNQVRPIHLLAIPLVFSITLVPSALAGRPISELLSIYLHQADTYDSYSLGAASLWSFLQDIPYSTQIVLFGLAGAATATCALIAFLFTARRRGGVSLHEVLCFLIVVPLITPKMHERFFFPADVFSLVLAFVDPRVAPLAVIVNLGSLLSYLPYLFGEEVVPLATISLIYLAAVGGLIRYILRANRVAERAGDMTVVRSEISTATTTEISRSDAAANGITEIALFCREMALIHLSSAMRRRWFKTLWFSALIMLTVVGIILAGRHPYGLDQRPAIGAFLDGRLPAKAVIQTGQWNVVEAFPKLHFDDPTSLVPEPQSNRLYVSSRQGKIEWFENDPATAQKFDFLDLTDVTQGWDDCGLLSFVFHPEFGQPASPNRGYVYVWYHYSPSPIPGPRRPPVDTPGYNRLSRFTVLDGARIADRHSELVLINQVDHNIWHDGSGMFFGQDGFLYLGVSDEGGEYDSYRNSQTIRGKIFSGVLRIDVDCNSRCGHPIRRQPQQEDDLPDGFSENNYTANYFIPNDNPFLDPGGSLLEEFWAIGLRNPHRMTLDRATGRIWAGDVGQDKWEEVDIIERGGNYQWAYLEGTHRSIQDGIAKPKPAAKDLIGTETPPVYEYGHGTDGNCIIGGYVYRGQQWMKELGGKYLFGDNGSGRIWSLAWDGTSSPTVEYLCNMPPGSNYTGLSSFGVDQQGELYLCKMGRPSKIYKLAPAEETGRTKSITFAAPQRLSWVGAFTDLQKLTPVPGCVPYDVNSPLWSDGAQKDRWIAMPVNDSITIAPTGEWTFPDGTVFIKNFEIVVNEITGEKRRLETRFLVRQAGGGVYGVAYKWHRDNAEAELIAKPENEAIEIVSENGVRRQSWYYPGPLDCLVCHNPNSGGVLGVNARQLNRRFEYPTSGMTDNQLRTWSHLGLFNEQLDENALDKLAALVRVDDKSAPLEARVRSYLDANCAHCHRPNGAAGYFDARFETPQAEQGLINGRLAKTIDIADAKVVCPGDVNKSVLCQRLETTGSLQMPPLARNVVDSAAATTIHDWIDSLPRAKHRE